MPRGEAVRKTDYTAQRGEARQSEEEAEARRDLGGPLSIPLSARLIIHLRGNRS